MKSRFGFSRKGWLFGAVTGVAFSPAMALWAETDAALADSPEAPAAHVTTAQAADSDDGSTSSPPRLLKLFSKARRIDERESQTASTPSEPVYLRPVATDPPYEQDMDGRPASAIRQTAQINGPTPSSEVQRQLEELYRRDGREMPPMQLPAAGQSGPAAQSRVISPPARVPQPDPRRSRPTLLQRIFPFTRKKSEPKPPSYVQPPPQIDRPARVRVTPPAPQAAPRAQQAVPPAPQPVPPAPQEFSQETASPLSSNAARPEMRRSQLNPTPADPVPVETPAMSETNNGPNQPEILIFEDAPAAENNAESSATNTESAPTESFEDPLGDFESPFTEVSEAEADRVANPATTLTVEADATTGGSGHPLNSGNGSADSTAASQEPIPTIEPAVEAPEEESPFVRPDAPPVGVEPQLPQPPTAVAEQEREPVESPAVAPPSVTDKKLRLIAERKGLTGLKGYCIVALRDDRQLLNGNVELSSVHNGQTYYFSSAEAKLRFDENPDSYAPMYDGYDATLLAIGDERVKGSLDHALWYQDRLYLFCSRTTLQLFVGQPERFAPK